MERGKRSCNNFCTQSSPQRAWGVHCPSQREDSSCRVRGPSIGVSEFSESSHSSTKHHLFTLGQPILILPPVSPLLLLIFPLHYQWPQECWGWKFPVSLKFLSSNFHFIKEQQRKQTWGERQWVWTIELFFYVKAISTHFQFWDHQTSKKSLKIRWGKKLQRFSHGS